MTRQNKSIVITSKPIALHDYLKETWNTKGMIGAFFRRDFKIRYAQTFIGVFWVVAQPILYLLAFLLAFGTLLGDESNQVPYVLFPITGLLVWSYFSFCMQQSGSALIRSQEIIRKAYFPRIILPVSKSVVGLIDLLVTIVLLISTLIFLNIGF